MRTVAIAVTLLLTTLSAQAPKPLPDRETFVREVRARLEPDEDRQRDYVYVETRREIKVDRSGRQVGEDVEVFEAYPGLPGEERWLRRIRKNGRPVPADELTKEDRKRQEKAEAFLRASERRTPAERAKLQRDQARERQKTREMVDDAFRVYDIQMLGRETLAGHDAITFSLTPRRGATTRTRAGGILRHVRVRAWVSESDYELMRIEAEAIDTLSVGLGLLARVHKGSRFAFERRKVDGAVWLPARSSYTASARVLLLKGLRLNGISEFSDYRRFSVDTDTTYAGPASAAGRAD